MNSRKLSTLLMVLSLAAPAVYGQVAAAASASAPVANPIDPASIQALKDMGAHLQSLSRFHTSTTLTGERVLTDGQKLQHIAYATLDVERPDKLHARMWSARSERELFFDGKTFTIFVPAQKYYSSVAFSGTNAELVDRLQQHFGVEIPLSDLFKWGTPAAPVEKIESAMNAGQDFVGNDLCDHYAFRQGNFDWQIWITTGSKPLPRKLVIANRADDARPQSISIIDWNLKPVFNISTFRFTPSKGTTKIEIVPVKAK